MNEGSPDLTTLGGSLEGAVLSRSGSGYLGSQPLRLSPCLSHSGRNTAGPLASY